MLVSFIDDIDSSHGDGISVVLDTDKGLHIEAAQIGKRSSVIGSSFGARVCWL